MVAKPSVFHASLSCLWKRGRVGCGKVGDGVVVECLRCDATWLLLPLTKRYRL
jgi:hypothetical protein